MPGGNCTEVTAECPVSATVYGYEPNLPANAIICAVFALLIVLQLGSLCCFRIRNWSYMIPLAIGTGLEVAGYIGRLIMSKNPWNTVGVSLQLITLIVAPSFMAAAVSVTFKHIIVYSGAEHSPIRPRFIPLVMIGSDFLGIVIQFVGAAIVATSIGSSEPDPSRTDTGNDIVIFGIAFQVVVLVGSAAFMTVFWRRTRRAKAVESAAPEAVNLTDVKQSDQSTTKEVFRFKLFVRAMAVGFVTLFIRSIYRLIEMGSGWGSAIMKDEAGFLVCDGLMVIITAISLTVFQPGFYFVPMMRKKRST